MKGFIKFIKDQGIVGLAIGFILGGAISKLVASLVSDIINPLLGIVLGFAGGIKDSYFEIVKVKITWGNFASTLIDFIFVAAVVYGGTKLLKLDSSPNKK